MTRISGNRLPGIEIKPNIYQHPSLQKQANDYKYSKSPLTIGAKVMGNGLNYNKHQGKNGCGFGGNNHL